MRTGSPGIDKAVPKDLDLHLVLDNYGHPQDPGDQGSVTELENDIRKWTSEWNMDLKPLACRKPRCG